MAVAIELHAVLASSDDSRRARFVRRLDVVAPVLSSIAFVLTESDNLALHGQNVFVVTHCFAYSAASHVVAMDQQNDFACNRWKAFADAEHRLRPMDARNVNVTVDVSNRMVVRKVGACPDNMSMMCSQCRD